MDADRFRKAYQRLELLEERRNHKIRGREGLTMSSSSQRQLEEKLRDLSEYTLELEQVVRELFLSIAGQPAKKEPPPAGTAGEGE